MKARVYPPAPERFQAKVKEADNGCWVWTASLTKDGYGNFRLGPEGTRLAHRWSYEHFVGPIPTGMAIDHLCRNRACVNPHHLEPVTWRENTLRSPIAPGAVNAAKTECIYGHPYDEVNTRWFIGKRGNRHRACRACDRRRTAESNARRRKVTS